MESGRALVRLSRSIFSTAHYRDVLAHGASRRLEDDLAFASAILLPGSRPARRAVVYEMWTWLVANRRTDTTLRAVFMSRSDSNPILPNANMFAFELRAGQSIIDFACLEPGFEEGLEIKSTYDSATRLSAQIESYRRVFPRVSLVGDAADSSRMRALATRHSTGLILMDGAGREWSLTRVAQAPVGYGSLSRPALVGLLRLNELRQLVLRLGLGEPDAMRANMYPVVAASLEDVRIEDVVRETYKLISERRRLSARLLTREVAAPLRSIVATIDPPRTQLSHLDAWLGVEV